MLYKTVGLAAASAVCALMVGCANTTTGKMVEPLEVMPTEVCIIQNPKVTIGEAIPSLQSAFQRRGIKTTVVRDAASCTSEYRLSYVMQRSWDATTYLGLAELTLYKNGAIVSTAKYKAPEHWLFAQQHMLATPRFAGFYYTRAAAWCKAGS